MAEKDIEKEEVKKNKPKKKWFRKILKWFFGLIVLLVVVVAGGIYYAYNAKDKNSYIMHKPHPSNIIKGYIMRDILNFLIKNNYIK